MPTTTASRLQAATSPTAAAARAIAPIRLCTRPCSVRMRASTGKAVTLIATPTNSANVSGVAFAPASPAGSRVATSAPATRGIAVPATLTATAACARSPR